MNDKSMVTGNSNIKHHNTDNKYVNRKLSVFKINLSQAVKLISFWVIFGIFIILNLFAQIFILLSGEVGLLFSIISWANVILVSIISVITVYYFFKKQVDEGYHGIEVRSGIKHLSSFWQRILICGIMQFTPIILMIITSLVFVVPSDLILDVYLYKILLPYFTYMLIEILMSAISLFGIFMFKNSSIIIIVPIILSFVIFISPFVISMSSFSDSKNATYIRSDGTNTGTDSYTWLQTNEYFEYSIGKSVYDFLEQNDLNNVFYNDFVKLKDTQDRYNSPGPISEVINIYWCGLFNSTFLKKDSTTSDSDFVGSDLSKFIDEINIKLNEKYINVNQEDCLLFVFGNNKIPEEYQLTNIFDYLSTQEYTSIDNNLAQGFLNLMSNLSKNIEYIINSNNLLDSSWTYQIIDDEIVQNNPDISPLDYGINWFMMNAIRTSWCVDSDLVYFITNPWDREWDKYNTWFNPLYHFSIMLSPPINNIVSDSSYYQYIGTSFNRNTKIYIPDLNGNMSTNQFYDEYKRGLFNDWNTGDSYYDYDAPIMSNLSFKEKRLYSPGAIFAVWYIISISALIGTSFLYKSKMQK